MDSATNGATWNDMFAGALVILLSFPRGKIGGRYGSFERFIR
jgi:hypothetical protein